MSLLTVVLVSAVGLFVAYHTYGSWLARLLRLDPCARTPAVELRDDLDYLPLEPKSLLSQHFSAIAAAGPIVGPILAGVMFGWAPAILWIIVGSIFIGGVHDFCALTASIRHQARSIAEVVREHMSRRSYVLFMLFVWFALLYIIVAFTDITASSFIGTLELENGQKVSGGGIASSSILYLILPVVMGFLLRFTRLGIGPATIIFLPLVGLSIGAGQYLPVDVEGWLGGGETRAHQVWNLAILAYCFIASLVPVWALLQPRGHLGGYFLFLTLIGGSLGLMFGGEKVQYPAFTGWSTPKGEPLLPLLFITVACGACSGFHAVIASGTTSKQLRSESDAKLVGYGAMLMEGMVAVVSLCCVMRLTKDSPLLTSTGGPKPNFLYAQGIGSFLSVLGVPTAFGVSFGLMAFTTFVYDTLDVCTRLGRYIIEELTGWRSRAGRAFAAVLTVGVPIPLLLRQNVDPSGKIVPAWRVFWNLFGASNQLLAALTLLGVTVWLWRTRRARWVLAVCGLPTILMYAMSMWALLRIIRLELSAGISANPVLWVAMILVTLAVLLIVDAVLAFVASRVRPSMPMPAASA
ncbi:MAG: carbon starvation CstA family protein [Planctomycetota bacterium]